MAPNSFNHLLDPLDQLKARFGAGEPRAIERLLTADMRPDANAHDVLMALGGISLIAASEGRRDLAGRLIDLLLHGILV